MPQANNVDPAVVDGFGDEWSHFDQSKLSHKEKSDIFADYFAIFPWDQVSENAVGADIGCGSGRWAALVAPRVAVLHCIEPAAQAMAVAKRNLVDHKNCRFHSGTADDIPLPDDSLDFAYSLGVLHHIPDTAQALRSCVRKLKPGAPFLVYLYYAMENRPFWFRMLWRFSDVGRRVISSLPRPLARGAAAILAAGVYLPVSRIALFGEKLGFNVGNWPLSAYRKRTFYVLATDSLDRFGTQLEHRFTRREIEEMMLNAGLQNIRFSECEPYWTALGYRT